MGNYHEVDKQISLRNCLKHESPRMLRAAFLAIPHEPFIMQHLTIRYSLRWRIESRELSGSSATQFYRNQMVLAVYIHQ